MDLNTLGWDAYFARHFEIQGNGALFPARVAQEHKALYTLWSERGELLARVSGRFMHGARSRADFPTVGDWVLVGDKAGDGDSIIHVLLPRRSCFSRKAVLAGGPTQGEGRTEEQVLAANIDVVFLVSGLDNDWNPRRIERFLSTTYESGASPVIILNKADVCDDVSARMSEVSRTAPGVPVLAMSAVARTGLEAIRNHLKSGRTAVFLGSSGVGKSTIINGLLGEDRLETGGVRLHDSRGRHTTTRRQLIVLPDGGLVIDTPGLRRIQLWGDETGIERTYADVEQLIDCCRFSDCQHESEPGCAVKEAIETGNLDSARFAAYQRLQKELQNLLLRQDARKLKQADRARGKMYDRILKDREKLRKKGLM